MTLFKKVSTEKLRLMADELGGIYAEDHTELRVAQFARTLSVMMLVELHKRGVERITDDWPMKGP